MENKGEVILYNGVEEAIENDEVRAKLSEVLF